MVDIVSHHQHCDIRKLLAFTNVHEKTSLFFFPFFFFAPVNLHCTPSYLDADLCIELSIYWTISSLILTGFQTKRFVAIIFSLINYFPIKWCKHIFFNFSQSLLNLLDLKF